MSSFDDQLHQRDDKFGAIVLLVCANASRYSSDPRTLLEGGHLHSAGWKWFSQVEPFTRAVLSGPELYDLQVAVVSVPLFLSACILGLTGRHHSLLDYISTVPYRLTKPGYWSASVCD